MARRLQRNFAARTTNVQIPTTTVVSAGCKGVEVISKKHQTASERTRIIVITIAEGFKTTSLHSVQNGNASGQAQDGSMERIEAARECPNRDEL